MSGAEPRRIVIADTPSDELVHIRDELAAMLEWGLSKQARKAVEIKVKAIDLTLAEREKPPE